jgi:LmbE family N-acetylglucosaminyl deacetylase
MKKNILVISAHPDDEALGCGGTLFKHKKNGDQITWAIITHKSESAGYSAESILQREKEIQKVSELLDMKQVMNLKLAPASLTQQHIPEICTKIGKLINEQKITTIYCVNRSDAHSDHRIVFEAASTFIKSFRYPTVTEFYCYECLSETEFAPPLSEKTFLPNHYVNVSENWSQKLELIQVYSSEMAQHPFPRSLQSINAQGILRGAYAGVEYAEAFMTIKSVQM